MVYGWGFGVWGLWLGVYGWGCLKKYISLKYIITDILVVSRSLVDYQWKLNHLLVVSLPNY